MRTRSKITIAAGLAALTAGVVFAGATYADSGGWGYGGHHFGRPHHEGWMSREGGRHHGARRMMRMFEAYDTNGDGRLTQAEINEARRARLAEFDSDGDGSLTLEEYQALWLDAMRERMVDRFQDRDADGDGKVTGEEFAAPFDSIVRFMDRNDDDAISRDDMMRWRHRDDDRRGGMMRGPYRDDDDRGGMMRGPYRDDDN